MWITNCVDIPDEILKAIELKKLVVFAGAGVSMGAPARLPSFWGLSEQLDPSSSPFKPIDQYIGSLESRGINVRCKVHELLSQPESQTTALHKDILALFRKAEDVRIVTTNFDTLFSSAASEIFSQSVEEYYAPALPLGRNFNGIIHLHGSLKKDERYLVLTDRDFGQAYLTDGWGRRFLQDMFINYVVLFIGYGHTDPIIDYLARALPPGTQRYAFSSSNDVSNWKKYNIEPILFELLEEDDKYSQMNEAVHELAVVSNQGIFDYEARIVEITNKNKSLDYQDGDYLENCLKRFETTRIFCKNAKSIKWLKWVADKKSFLRIFQTETEPDTTMIELSYWFSDMVFNYPDETMEVFFRMKSKMSVTLWNTIAGIMWRNIGNLSSQHVSWIIILLENHNESCNTECIQWILNDINVEEFEDICVEIFQWLITPSIQLKQSLSMYFKDEADGKIDYEIAFKGSEHELTKVWKDKLSLRLPHLSDRFEAFIKTVFQKTYYLQKMTGIANSTKDRLSYRRSAIESHKQDRYREVMDVAIDIARGLMDDKISSSPIEARILIDEWASAEPPLLKRLSIYGMTMLPATSEEKIRWVASKGFVFNYATKHESFMLLKKCYPCANKDVQREFVEYLDRFFKIEKEDEENDDYEAYNLFAFINKWAPDCKLVSARLKEITEHHPKYQMREYPDLHSYFSSGSVERQPPIQSKELIEKNPADLLEFLKEYDAKDIYKRQRWSLLNEVMNASSKSFNWSLSLGNILADNELWDSDLWTAVLDGWRQSGLQEEQWRAILNFFLIVAPQIQDVQSVISVLVSYFRRESEDVSYESLNDIEKISGIIFARAISLKSERPVTPEDTGDLYLSACSSVLGEFCSLILHCAYARKNMVGSTWSGLPNQYKTILLILSEPNTNETMMSSIIIGSNLHNYHYLDMEWTIEHLMPRFKWSGDSKCAQVYWIGFLSAGRWNDKILELLMNDYIECVDRMYSELSCVSDRLADHFAGIAVYSYRQPIEEGWLFKFISVANSGLRLKWTTEVGQIIEDFDPEKRKVLWDKWVKNYWSHRNRGIPCTYSDEEVEVLIKWPVIFGVVFDQAVDLLENMHISSRNIRVSSVIYQLANSGPLSANPEKSCHMLNVLLRIAHDGLSNYSMVDKMVRTLIGKAIKADLLVTCELLKSGGYDKATELREAVLEMS